MSNNNGILRAIVQVNHAQVPVTQPIEASPFSSHWLDAGHCVRILREVLQFSFKLDLDSRVHSFEVARSAAVNDDFWHPYSLESERKAPGLRRRRSRRVDRRSTLAFSSRSKPRVSAI